MRLVTRVILGCLRLRPVRAVFLFFAPFVERAISHYYGAKKVVLGAALEAEVDARFERLVDARSEEMLVQVTEHALARATPGARRRFFLWAEEKAAWDPSGLAYAERTAAHHVAAIVRARGTLEGARILELGPGQTLVTGVLLHAHGAASYEAVDMFPVPEQDARIYARLREHLAARPELLARCDAAVRIDGERVVLSPERVAYRHPVDAAKLPSPDASFDVVISNAAFEHFLDPEAAIRECARVTAPGGVGLHQIDLRDHRDFSRPLEFLKHSDAEWRALCAGKPEFTNRLRMSDFERAFEAAGFSVTEARVEMRASVPAALRASLDARFRERPQADLEPISVFFALRRRPADEPAAPHRSTAGTRPRA